ncbi:Oligo-1,6-glucosidase 1 [compost metagenome]
MQWDASHNGGFTKGEPWIDLCNNVDTINVAAALNDPDSVFYAYQSLIQLRKTLPVLTWGDYQDLLPEHPFLWCYRRQWQGQTLIVAANLSGECQQWHPDAHEGDWRVVLSNYAEVSSQPIAMTLRPFEAIWWLQD